MKLVVNTFETRRIDMRIDLSGCDIGVPQHLLNVPQVGSPGEHVRRKAVSQRVWANRRGNTDSENILFDQLPNRLAP